MKWHPDKNPNNKKDAKAKFKQISKAYEGLKGQVPPPGAGAGAGAGPAPGPGGASFFSTGDGPTTFRFNPRNADDIFADFFGFSGPFGVMGGGNGGMRGTRFPNGMLGDNIFSSFGEGGGGSMHQSAPRKSPPIEKRLLCSLEELYKGATKTNEDI
ncbi:hypothetical protein OIU84_029192 [Salix udensis]|uniref:J domain-containing protein n=1 Tax=Salix udensis TaxID=889485 RepID=A0AAD6P7M3_9ROSI|nr:hypothetical protein OIU84_029192 [Salix udensis]